MSLWDDFTDGFMVEVEDHDGADTLSKLFSGSESGLDKALNFSFTADGYGHETRLFGRSGDKETELDWWNDGAGLWP